MQTTNVTTSYEIRDNTVFYCGDMMKNADASSFVAFNEHYAKDAHRVYFAGQILRHADPASFLGLNPLYGKDKETVFYLTSQLPQADAETFEVLDVGKRRVDYGFLCYRGFARDKNYVYHFVGTYKPNILRGADPATFEVLNSSYGRDARKAYRKHVSIPRARPATFHPLSDQYSTDGNRVFWVNRQIPEADAETFTVLTIVLAKDARHVYDGGMKVEDADPSSVHCYPECDYIFKDATHVFAHGKILKGADAATFVSLGGLYFQDGNHIYAGEKRMDGADPTTFVVFPNGRARDAKQFYQGDFVCKVPPAASYPLSWLPQENASVYDPDTGTVVYCNQLKAYTDLWDDEHILDTINRRRGFFHTESEVEM